MRQRSSSKKRAQVDLDRLKNRYNNYPPKPNIQKFETFQNPLIPQIKKMPFNHTTFGEEITSKEKDSYEDSMYNTDGVKQSGLINLQNYALAPSEQTSDKEYRSFEKNTDRDESLNPDLTRRGRKIPDLNLNSLNGSPSNKTLENNRPRKQIYINDSGFKVAPYPHDDYRDYSDNGNNDKLDRRSLEKTKESSASNRFYQYADSMLNDEMNNQAPSFSHGYTPYSPYSNNVTSPERPRSKSRESYATDTAVKKPHYQLSPNLFKNFPTLEMGNISLTETENGRRSPLDKDYNPISSLLRQGLEDPQANVDEETSHFDQDNQDPHD
jgi:hypothetical protein